MYKLKTDVAVWGGGGRVFQKKNEKARGEKGIFVQECEVFITLKKVEQDKHVSTDLQS
jgi:hypothetical protein